MNDVAMRNCIMHLLLTIGKPVTVTLETVHEAYKYKLTTMPLADGTGYIVKAVKLTKEELENDTDL